jgi:hypothetical protein
MLELAVVILAVHVVDFMDDGAPHVCTALDIPAGRNGVRSGKTISPSTKKSDSQSYRALTMTTELSS